MASPETTTLADNDDSLPFAPSDLTGTQVLTAFRQGQTPVRHKDDAADASLTAVISPTTNEPVCWFQPTPTSDIEAIVQEAHTALQQPAAPNSPPWCEAAAGSIRAAVLQRWAALLRQHVGTLARLEVQQIGRPYKEMKFQLSRLPEWFEYFAAVITTHHDVVTPWQGSHQNMVIRLPLGVVAQITPFNHPLLITIKKLAPALAAGNAVVIKPSELAPASILALVQLGHMAGVPPGIVNVVLGAKTEVQCLIRHPLIAKVDFTGGPRTGAAIGAAAGENLAAVTQELGGKAPMIVCAPQHYQELMTTSAKATVETKYLTPVVNGCAFGAFIASGQTCIAGTRLLVDAVWYADFVQRLVDKTKVFVLGDPLDLQTTIGPVITRRQMDWIHDTLQAGVAQHADMLQIKCGGDVYTSEAFQGTPLAQGNYYQPTIVAVDPIWAARLLSSTEKEAAQQALNDLHHSSPLFQTELFGPVVVVIPFVDDAHAIQLANDTPFGLGASIWSHDLIQAQTLARRVRAGIVWINDHHKNHPSSPWGGLTKQSGIGRENGTDAFLEYTQGKSIVTNCGPFTSDWFQDPNARYN